jgi:hypothetical protein
MYIQLLFGIVCGAALTFMTVYFIRIYKMKRHAANLFFHLNRIPVQLKFKHLHLQLEEDDILERQTRMSMEEIGFRFSDSGLQTVTLTYDSTRGRIFLELAYVDVLLYRNLVMYTNNEIGEDFKSTALSLAECLLVRMRNC